MAAAELRLLAVLAIVGALAGLAGRQTIVLHKSRADVARAELATNALRASYDSAALASEQDQRRKEREMQDATERVAAAYRSDRDAAARRADAERDQRMRIERALRAGGPGLMCPAVGAAGRDDGADPVGFLLTYIDRVETIGREADRAADRLRACQRYVNEARRAIN